MFYRHYRDLDKEFRKNRVLILYGPRRVGKTTLLEAYLASSNRKYLLETGDNVRFAELIASRDLVKFKELTMDYDIIAIDEAQMIPNIGFSLKLLVDYIPDTIFIATGSSSFKLSQKTGEPLTGRKRTVVLYPLAQDELIHDLTKYELYSRLEEFLLYGSYPEVLAADSRNEKIEIITELTDSYLLKDILTLEQIKSSKIILDLLRLLAFQIGNQVSSYELASSLGIDVKTVNRYLDLLEKSFVIRQLGAYSRNLRNEITKKKKYYFFDTGIRNSLIANFNTLSERNDTGQLFEQFLITERLKHNAYHGFYGNSFFWRTYSGQEIDYIEEIDGVLYGYEFKWGKKIPKAPRLWVSSYPESHFNVINRDNYLDFLLP